MLNQQFKALVVDDDPIARRTVCFALGKEDFSCAFASDGDDALKRLTAEHFDVVVTDLRMPNKHGHALVTELRARENCPIVVVHTSVDDPRLTKDLMTRGVDDIVYKPANYAAFAAKTKALVQRRNQTKPQATTAVKTAPEVQSHVTNEPAVADTARLIELQCPVPPISRAEYERRLTNVQHLFPLSSAAYDVFVLSNSEETTTAKLVSTLLLDAALTADILRLANSAFYNRNASPTIEVEEAVRRIGFKKVGEVALALNALGTFRGCILPWLDADLGQARSLAASIALERLCEVCLYRTANDGMTLCAFLHPLGRLILGSAFQDEYRSLIRTCLERHTSLGDLESHVFPETHTAAISRMLSQWHVPADIWGPLFHLGESYESIARLEEPIRSRVELIKLAVFIGHIAVGRWMLWDQIEPPPGHVLSRHELSNFSQMIEQTRADLGQLADSHKSPNGPAGFGGSAELNGERTQQVRYSSLSGSNIDIMPLLLASLGIETMTHEIGEGDLSGGILVNCLNARPVNVLGAIRRKEWGNLKPLFVVADNTPSEVEKHGMTIRFPASVAALRTSCEQLTARQEVPTSD
jgi:CheY-like chemotaxis protein/HD-like signal output (HDOD) protein